MASTEVLRWARILIVDDEEVNVRLLERVLQEASYVNLHSTTNPLEVMSLYRTFAPDLVVLDLMMPHLDGFEVVAQLRREIPEGTYLPILMITADSTPETKIRALAADATDFLTKPIEIAEVRLRINNLLHTRLFHLQLAEQNTSLEARVRERTREIEELWLTTVDRLGLIAEFRDDETHLHTVRVGRSAEAIAREMSLAPDQVTMLSRAAPLHDLGKIAIPDRILLKLGRLTEDEFEEMKAHTSIGARIVEGTSSPLLEMARQVALFHHERWDGSGYARLVGAGIPLGARIVSVADVFDALVNVRPYKAAWPVDQALAEIKSKRGRPFDPDVIDAFFLVVDRVGADWLLQYQLGTGWNPI